MRARSAALATTLLAAGVAGACPLQPQDGAPLSDAAVQLAWRAEPAPIAARRPFALLVAACPHGVRLLRVDATMPEHGHGMNYRPSLQAVAAGRWRAEGLLWHMSGRWELSFEVEHDGQVRRLRQSVVLP